MKKVYIQPTTDVLEMHVENLMLTVSVNSSSYPGSGGSGGAPIGG